MVSDLVILPSSLKNPVNTRNCLTCCVVFGNSFMGFISPSPVFTSPFDISNPRKLIEVLKTWHFLKFSVKLFSHSVFITDSKLIMPSSNDLPGQSILSRYAIALEPRKGSKTLLISPKVILLNSYCSSLVTKAIVVLGLFVHLYLLITGEKI